jgi:hypothetical protein
MMGAPYSAAAGWGTPVVVSGEADDVLLTRIAVNANGEALAVTASSSTLYAARYSNGAWSPAVPVESDVFLRSDNVEIALDDQGAAVIVYTDEANSGAVYANRFASAAWGAQEVLKANAWAPRRPRIAMRGNGEAVIAWVEGEVEHQMWARPYGALSGPVQNIGANNSRSTRFDLEVDPDGSVLLAWANYHAAVPDVRSVLASRYTPDTGQWSTPEEAAAPAMPATPDLAIDPFGNAAVVWVTDEDAGDTIEASVYR